MPDVCLAYFLCPGHEIQYFVVTGNVYFLTFAPEFKNHL